MVPGTRNGVSVWAPSHGSHAANTNDCHLMAQPFPRQTMARSTVAQPAQPAAWVNDPSWFQNSPGREANLASRATMRPTQAQHIAGEQQRGTLLAPPPRATAAPRATVIPSAVRATVAAFRPTGKTPDQKRALVLVAGMMVTSLGLFLGIFFFQVQKQYYRAHVPLVFLYWDCSVALCRISVSDLSARFCSLLVQGNNEYQVFFRGLCDDGKKALWALSLRLLCFDDSFFAETGSKSVMGKACTDQSLSITMLASWVLLVCVLVSISCELYVARCIAQRMELAQPLDPLARVKLDSMFHFLRTLVICAPAAVVMGTLIYIPMVNSIEDGVLYHTKIKSAIDLESSFMHLLPPNGFALFWLLALGQAMLGLRATRLLGRTTAQDRGEQVELDVMERRLQTAFEQGRLPVGGIRRPEFPNFFGRQQATGRSRPQATDSAGHSGGLRVTEMVSRQTVHRGGG